MKTFRKKIPNEKILKIQEKYFALENIGKKNQISKYFPLEKILRQLQKLFLIEKTEFKFSQK